LESGNYKLFFYPISGYCIPEWHDNSTGCVSWSGAEVISITAGSEVTIDAELATGGTISGVATEEGTGVPIGDCQVRISNTSGAWLYTTRTRSDGTYTTPGLPPGDYKLCFYPNPALYVYRWYENSASSAGAMPITVATAGVDVPGKNIELAACGTISGTVTVEVTGAPIANCQVRISSTSGAWLYTAWTDASGVYHSPRLPAGDYKLCFYANPSLYVYEWYENSANSWGAKVVSVGAGREINISASLDGLIK
jgi:hypothetical protein